MYMFQLCHQRKSYKIVYRNHTLEAFLKDRVSKYESLKMYFHVDVPAFYPLANHYYNVLLGKCSKSSSKF